MKRAKMYYAAVEFTCPYCEEHLSSESGSQTFLVNELPEDPIECCSCGKQCTLPAKARKLQ